MVEFQYAEKQPKVPWLDTIFKNMHSLGSAGVDVLKRQEQKGRRITITGLENIPTNGPVILASNHFVRMTDVEHALGPHKMEDLLSSVGAITLAVRNRRGPDASVIWTPTSVPRPEAILKKRASTREVLKWLSEKGPSMGVSNSVRSVFLWLFRDARDVIPADPRKTESFLGALKDRLSQGEAVGIFPEGEVSNAMRRGRFGVSHIAIDANAPVIPVSQYAKGGELVVTVGTPLRPPGDRKEARSFHTTIMRAISSALPPELRGFYGEERKASE